MHTLNSKKVIAADQNYRLRDNQFWYSDCSFADQIRHKVAITLRIAGLGIRTLSHSAPGRDGRPTYSFKLPSSEDRVWWGQHRGERVRIELMDTSDDLSGVGPEPTVRSEVDGSLSHVETGSQTTTSLIKPGVTSVESSILCIGLDIAWFGGSAKKPDSQYDCLASTLLQSEAVNLDLNIDRIKLHDRDPQAKQLIEAISILLENYPSVGKVIFAIDAPLQAVRRDNLPVRKAALEKGSVKRRACESHLSARRQAIDALAGKSEGWHPNIPISSQEHHSHRA